MVEDDRAVAEEFAAYFRKRQNSVVVASTLGEAEEAIAHERPDAVILDIILPDGDGLDLFERCVNLPPVIVMSTLGTDYDVLDGFAAGATDYVVKPCAPEVLEARLVLRLLPKAEAVIESGGLRIDTTERLVTYHGAPLALTGSEFNILYFFMTHSSVFFTAAEIYENVWHAPNLGTTTIKYHISNLRQKLVAATGKNLIQTQFGKGYAFCPMQE